MGTAATAPDAKAPGPAALSAVPIGPEACPSPAAGPPRLPKRKNDAAVVPVGVAEPAPAAEPGGGHIPPCTDGRMCRSAACCSDRASSSSSSTGRPPTLVAPPSATDARGAGAGGSAGPSGADRDEREDGGRAASAVAAPLTAPPAPGIELPARLAARLPGGGTVAVAAAAGAVAGGSTATGTAGCVGGGGSSCSVWSAGGLLQL